MHDTGILTSGTVDGEKNFCPRQGQRLPIKTGLVLALLTCEDIATFHGRVEDGLVKVRDGRWD
ncbi:MAG: hypothetical protein IPJ48_01280 [Propionivibrio sp.]|uniref:Uncharacterized protein n=1 Tax=Candidatus Propionivibrio dominans TaxID=2954373 RepID=A0A9D7FBL9_9RHOO|nr:hypothetical protein [Candidatus Propionivibrio dominans]